MESIAILMSTYNGEKYLREQIDSIIAQQNVEVKLIVRDDGSSDKTIDIFREYLIKHDNITFIQGENVGVGNSFMALVREAGSEFDYYAFADQDDIWMPEKMKKAIAAIKNKEGPWCYCSNQMLVDADRNVIGKRHEKPIDVSYMQILCNNLVTGCTMVWNQELQKILTRDKSLPSKELLIKRIHDVWVAMVAAVLGNIYYDPDSYIMYRQHENNVVGVKGNSLFYEWKKKIKDPSLRNGRSCLAREILETTGDLITDINKKNNLQKYAYYSKDKRQKKKVLKDINYICSFSGENASHLLLKVMLNLF